MPLEDFPYSQEDRLKILVYREIEKLNPGLYERDAREHIRLCTIAYEDRKTRFQKRMGQDRPRIRAYSLTEYLENQLTKIAHGYEKLEAEQRKKRDNAAFNLLRKFCSSIAHARPFYKVYKAARQTSS